MRSYAVYRQGEDVAFVKRGWSWPAFCFAPVWTLLKGQWRMFWASAAWGVALVALAVVAAVRAVANVSASPGETVPLVDPVLAVLLGLAYLGLVAWLGQSGNRAREKRLTKKGYGFERLVEASSIEEALDEYVSGGGAQAAGASA